LILVGALLLWVLRVKDPAIRLAAWTVMLYGSLAIPVLTRALPKIPLTVMRATTRPADSRQVVPDAAPAPVRVFSPQNVVASKGFDWPRAAATIYLLVAGTLLLRLCAGLWMSRRLLAGSRATGLVPEGIDVRESSRVAAPVTLGVVRSAILLPVDWREWEGNKLAAVLAHERSHIRRRDPAVQLLSAIHRALVWHSPLSWFLHRRIVRVSEEASDDAAVIATSDRASYAEILLDFMRRGTRGPNWHGVAMARYGRPDKRIHRILDETSLSRGITRWSVAAILAVVTPFACVVAAVHPQAQHTSVSPMDAAAPQTPASQAEPAPPAKTTARRFRRYMIFSGDSMSGSWDSRDPVDEQGLKARFGHNFVWFRQGVNEYVVTDAGVLAELKQAMEPQEEVNREQSEVNDQQSVVNSHQSDVNRAQAEVNSHQEQANRRQELLNELQSAKKDEELIKKMSAALAELQARKGATADQDTVNREQAKVNEMQAQVNEEQHKVNEQQSKVNESQARVSATFNQRIDEILDSAVRRHLPKQVK
ncbi:MAG: M56 family metallopeptidase, partial [Bryobacteraceae bacterium]